MGYRTDFDPNAESASTPEELLTTISTLQRRVTTLENALKYYAQPFVYEGSGALIRIPGVMREWVYEYEAPVIRTDKGEIARRALEKTE